LPWQMAPGEAKRVLSVNGVQQKIHWACKTKEKLWGAMGGQESKLRGLIKKNEESLGSLSGLGGKPKTRGTFFQRMLPNKPKKGGENRHGALSKTAVFKKKKSPVTIPPAGGGSKTPTEGKKNTEWISKGGGVKNLSGTENHQKVAPQGKKTSSLANPEGKTLTMGKKQSPLQGGGSGRKEVGGF